jgi:hypothetical protein
MWQRAQTFYSMLAHYRGAEPEACLLAVAERIVTLAQSPGLRIGEIADLDDWPSTMAVRTVPYHIH